MKRLQRAVIAILCVVCLAFGMIACGDDSKDSDKATYTVTVKAGSGVTGTDMRGVTVKLINTADGSDAAAAKELSLNSARTSGTAKFSLKKGNYTVDVGNINGLYVQGSVTLTSTVTKTTVTITDQAPPAPTVEYKVLFKLPNSAPVANTDVQICGGASGQCYPATTDASGWATWNQPAGDYEVHVPSTNWPNGYYFDDTAYSLTASTTTLTAEFRAYVSHTVKFSYADAETYNSMLYGVCDPGEPAAGVSFDVYKHTNADGGRSDGEKLITVMTGADGTAVFNGYDDCHIENIVDPNGCILGKDGTYVINKENAVDNGRQQFILHKPGACNSAPITLTTNKAETVEYNTDGADVWFEFPIKTSGIFTLTSTGDVAKNIKMYSMSGTNPNFYADIIAAVKDNPASEDITFVEDGNNFTLTIPVSEVYTHGSGVYLFAISAVDAVEVGSFTVTLTRTGDYVEPTPPELEVVEPEQMIAKAEMPAIPEESKLVFLSDGIYEESDIVKDDDGIYHLYNKTGKIIYASFGGKYSPSIFTNGGGFAFAIVESGGIGFTFSDGKTYSKNYASFVEKYVAGSNADGLHPLNDEIKDFLVYYSKSVMRSDLTYRYATGYYVERYTEVNVTEEEGKNVGVVAARDDYKVEVPANSTVAIANMVPGDTVSYSESAISLITENAAIKLSATEDGEAVKKVAVVGSGRCYIRNESASAVTVKFNVDYNTADVNINAVGAYVLRTLAVNTVTYTFTAPEDGVYCFAYDSDKYNAEIADEQDNGFTKTAELKRGAKLTIKVIPYMSENAGIMNFEITKPELATALQIGTTQNVLAKGESGIKYTLNVEEEGDYYFQLSDGNCWVGVMGEKGVERAPKYVHLTAGAHEYYLCTWTVAVCDVTIATGTPPLAAGSALSVGQKYTVSATYMGVTYKFTAPEDGTYVISSTNSNAFLGYGPEDGDPTWESTLTCVGGQTYTIWCSQNDMSGDSEYDLTITKEV